jgi:hypothetical protein
MLSLIVKHNCFMCLMTFLDYFKNSKILITENDDILFHRPFYVDAQWGKVKSKKTAWISAFAGMRDGRSFKAEINCCLFSESIRSTLDIHHCSEHLYEVPKLQ